MEQTSALTEDLNWEPLSKVRRAGTLNLENHVEMKALAQASAVREERGMAHQIQMDVRKSSTRDWNPQDWRLHVRLDLTLLTSETRSCPEANILGKARQQKPRGQEPPRSMCTRMRETMEIKEQLMT